MKFKNDEFDVVTAWHVIEHLVDPCDEVSEVYKILKEDGLFFIEIPNIKGLGGRIKGVRWKNLRPPEHLNYFSPKSLRLFLEKNGFKIIHLSTPTDDPQKRGRFKELAKIFFWIMKELKLGGYVRVVCKKT